MERLFGIALFIMIAAGVAYLLIAFVIIPIVKLFYENRRLKR